MDKLKIKYRGKVIDKDYKLVSKFSLKNIIKISLQTAMKEL